MANGDDVAAPTTAAPAPDGKKDYVVRNKKNGDTVTIRGPVGADMDRVYAKARDEFNRRATAPAVRDVPGALVRGLTKGIGGTLSATGQAAQTEMGQVGPGYPPVPGPTATAQVIERGLPAAVPRHEAYTTPGKMAERFGEFVTDPSTWIGPGGPIIKAATAVTGAIGSVLGERYGGALGSLAGGAVGGGVMGALAPRGLPTRVPKSIREVTTEGSTKAASKAAYKEMTELQYTMDPLAVGMMRDAIKAQLTKFSPAERRGVYDPEQIKGVMRIVDNMTTPKSRQNSIALIDIEHTRQLLSNERLEGGANALAASEAIEILDELSLNLPGVAEIGERARKNWAAYKRGQIVEETLRRAVDRAGGGGTGGNIDNVIRQEFRKLRNKPNYETVWSPAEKQEIEKILNPGYALNVARAISRLSIYRHTVTGGAGSTIAGMMTHDPLYALATFTAGEAAHQTAEFMQKGRAQRLAEMTRARSPAGGYYTPRPYPTRPFTGTTGAARGLGATALSPDTTERLELPEIVVRPPP
jgi:hypothetical protein